MENKKFIFLASLCVLTHIVRTVYEILKHRKKIVPGKLSFTIIFADMALLWISWFALCPFDTCKINLPGTLRYAGLLLSVIGLVIFLAALFTIKAVETHKGDMVTNGIYSKLRHPMYLAFIFWLIGFPVYCGAGIALILAVIFISNVLFWRYLEEKELVERYPDYPFYRRTTLF
jgi:protein-S-isoprenylcysteine O-methyltransferase Ste14